MTYKYGTYGEIVASIASLSSGAETIPVYIGTLPIHLVSGWRDRGLVNSPFKVKSLSDAQRNAGYCPDFKSYTLCEAIAAHYDSGVEGIGPIYMINVLDPAVHKSEMPQTEVLNFVNGRAVIAGNETILDSVKIARELPAELAELPAQTVEFRDKGTSKGDKGFDYAKAYAEAGIKLEGATLTYEPTGKIDPHIIHDGYVTVGLKFTKPASATHVAVKMNGQVVDDLDLTKDGDFVVGGELVEYINIADAAGNSLGDRHLEFECEWTGGETPKTALMVATNDGGYYEAGEDYEIAYNAARGGMLIQDLGTMPKNPTVTYELVDPAMVTAEDIVGDESANGELTGIQALKLLFLKEAKVANILAAPGWSGDPTVCAALGRACRKINGHFDAMYVVDIPLVGDDGEAIDTMEKAIKWKQSHEAKAQKGAIANSLPYNDERSKVCWPQALDVQDRVFHISTLCVATMLRIDQENGSVPMETPANKSVPIIKQYFGAASRNAGFDQRDADEIVSKGITTITPWATDWVLWGDHTAAYDYDEDGLDPRVIFDVSMRMLMHITNSFQLEWAPTIDQPMTRSTIDTIVNREQEKLDQYVSLGALIGYPTISFSPDDNDTTDLMNGNFTFQIAVTPTPPLKSATVKVCYTDEGFTTYWGEE